LANSLPQVTPQAIDLLQQLLVYHPEERLSAADALTHPWFDEVRDELEGPEFKRKVTSIRNVKGTQPPKEKQISSLYK